MADFRKAKYSGSLNLAPECGPVLIELDTEAKTATTSLEDPESQYTLAGGGGGLDYVVPEQTVTLTQSGISGAAQIQENGLETTMFFLLKTTDVEQGNDYYIPMSKALGADNTFTGYNMLLGDFTVMKSGDNWIIYLTTDQPMFPVNYAISAISKF